MSNPASLVTTDWLAERLNDPSIRIVEVDVDTKAYDEGHIPGAVGWNWQTELCDTVERDVIGSQALEALMSRSGITPETTIVLYGDNNNWFACWALWQLRIYGHADLRVLDGGRKKWLAEGREMSQEAPNHPATAYHVKLPDFSTRAYMGDVQSLLGDENWRLVDVRSPDEFSGKILSPPGLPETCQRGGHIPGAKSIPWGKNCNEDGTFKSPAELQAMYDAAGVTKDKHVVAYCRIGERSSLTWYVLTDLLGYDKVLNYDGSWTEWGNAVRVPVERGA